MTSEPRIWPGDQTRFEPLRVEATLLRAFASRHPVALDALLASQVAMSDGYPPPEVEERIPPAPLLWHPAGFHHASIAHFEAVGHEERHWVKKSPLVQDLSVLTRAKSINITAGQFRPYFMPLRLTMPAGGKVVWWCVGDREEILSLLTGVTGIGAKCNVGYGRVANWTVERTPTDWSVLRPGPHGPVPTRNVPRAMIASYWPWTELRRLTYPYWRADGLVECAYPRSR